MKTICTMALLLFYAAMYSQETEFGTSQNGLIYSDKAIKKLKHIVDSLNLKFKVCDNTTYYTALQGKGNYIRLTGIDAVNAKADLENNISFSAFKAKYTNAEIEEDILVVRSIYKDYDNKDALYLEGFASREDKGSVSFRGDEVERYRKVNQGWFFNAYNGYADIPENSIYAIYMDKPFVSVPVAEKYGRIIQYSDCLIDTTASIYFKTAKRTGVRYYTKSYKKLRKLEDYIDKKLNRPEYLVEEMSIAIDTVEIAAIDIDTTATLLPGFARNDDYYDQIKVWEANRLIRVDSLMQYDKKFKKFFLKLYKQAKQGSVVTDDEFEEYVGRYISKEEELIFKRNRRVVGGCSMDDSPRRHAVSIAELAAETTEWEIFLRSHLDIMNDRFERVSDGSYAWGARQTYIKELEVLDINVPDLLLGISLRVENASENHYFGSIGRIGRSLSESVNRDEIESEILTMIADKELDDYNRLLMYYLFANYNRNVKDENLQQANTKKLEAAVTYLPDYISSKLK